MEWMCLDFINSDWRDWRGSGRRANKLEDAEWCNRFAHRWEMPPLGAPNGEVMSVLLALRDILRGMIESLNAGVPFAESDLAVLNEAMASSPYRLRLTQADKAICLERIFGGQGWAEAMGRIAVSFVELVAGEDARRIKICDNEDCRWVFFDESRSRTKRWCDDKCCGNLLKVRRFRERRKAAPVQTRE